MMAYHHILKKTVESLTPTPSTQPLALSGSLEISANVTYLHSLPWGSLCLSLSAFPTGYGVETADISD